MSFPRRRTGPTAPLAWSYSRLVVYEDCAAKFKHKFIDKLPDPTSPAAARGLAVHGAAEAYLTKPRVRPPIEFTGPLRDALAEVRASIRRSARSVRGLDPATSGAPRVGAEVELAFDRTWGRVGWFDSSVWLRVKIDALVPRTNLYDVEMRAIDFKTGRPRPEHREQLELYALAVLKLDDHVESVDGELWYVDSDAPPVVEGFERARLRELETRWTKRARKLETERRWAPRPGPSCRWCPYSKNRGGPCAAAVG